MSKLKNLLEAIVISNSTEEAILLVENHYDHDHTTFHLLANPSAGIDNPFVRTTYSAEWVTHYLLNNYVVEDPIVAKAKAEGESFCWSELPARAAMMPIFKASAKFGLGTSGYSFVFTDERGRVGLFSVNSRMQLREWIEYITPRLDEFETILPVLHAKALNESTATSLGLPNLTPRECECLTLSSAGKSYTEIAIILNLSDHTVRSYLKMARVKLECVTLAQAVGKATRVGLI